MESFQGTNILMRRGAIEIANTPELIPSEVILEKAMLRKGISNAY
jgi:hypothetical protein